MRMKPTVSPLERDEMRIVAHWLNAQGALWLHPPNEGKRPLWVGARMKADGLLQPGAPDIIVLERYVMAPSTLGFGLAVELKRVGARGPSDAQFNWLHSMGQRGMLTTVAYGADQAIDFLQRHMRLCRPGNEMPQKITP